MFLPGVLVFHLAGRGRGVRCGETWLTVMSQTSWKLGSRPGVARNWLWGTVFSDPIPFPGKGADDPGPCPCLGACFGVSWCPRDHRSRFESPGWHVLTPQCLLSCVLAGSDGPCPQQLLAISEDGQTHHGTECLLLVLRVWLLLWPWGQRNPRG